MFKPVASIAAIITLAAAPFASAQMVANPAYENWSQFEPGSYSTAEVTTDMGGSDMKITMTRTLSALDDEKAVVETKITMNMGGQDVEQPAQSEEIPAEVTPEEADQYENPEGLVEEGEETLTIDGQEIETRWMKVVNQQDGNKTTQKVWLSDDIPGTMVKMEGTMEGQMSSENSMIVVDFEAK